MPCRVPAAAVAGLLAIRQRGVRSLVMRASRVTHQTGAARDAEQNYRRAGACGNDMVKETGGGGTDSVGEATQACLEAGSPLFAEAGDHGLDGRAPTLQRLRRACAHDQLGPEAAVE